MTFSKNNEQVLVKFWDERLWKHISFVYTSAPLTLCAVRRRRVSNVRLINFLWTWGEQRTPGARKRHPAHPVLFVFAQKTDKFQFSANGMRTVLRTAQHRFAVPSTHTHIWFANHLRAVCEPFGTIVYTRL